MSSRCWKTVIGHLFVLLFTMLVPSIWSEVSTSPMYLLYSQLWVWRKGPFDCAHHRSSPHCKQDGPWCRWRPPWCPSILRRAGHRPWSTWWSLSVIFWKHYSSVRQSQKEKKTTLDIEKDCCNKVRNKYPLLTNYITYCVVEMKTVHAPVHPHPQICRGLFSPWSIPSSTFLCPIFTANTAKK